MNDGLYTEWTLEDLLNEEKRMKNNVRLSNFLMGFLVGVMIYGIAKNGVGFLYTFIPLFLIIGIYKNSQNQKSKMSQIRKQIDIKSDIAS